ncbi:hypothetical protein [Arenimonas sp.]|uniref:hypothetical protein n=1 Tax=Arenimonas sp. TaxID=1872635 RepID=UPI0039E2A35A
MNATARLLPLALLFAVTSAGAAVSGQCNYKGKPVRFVDGRAAMAPDTFDEKGPKFATIWLVSAALDHTEMNAVPVDKIEDAITRHAFDKDSAELRLRLDETAKLVEQFYLYLPPGTNQSMSSNEVGSLKLSAPISKRASGRFQLKEDEYSCDLQFDLPMGAVAAAAAKPGKPGAVAAPAKPAGQPLPAGGGEPGKAYLALRKATLAGDVNGMLAHVKKENATRMRADMGKPEFPQMLEMVKAMEPKEVRIVSGTVNGDQATLKIAGKEADGAAMTGEVQLVRENGQWKVGKVNTESKISN